MKAALLRVLVVKSATTPRSDRIHREELCRKLEKFSPSGPTRRATSISCRSGRSCPKIPALPPGTASSSIVSSPPRVPRLLPRSLLFHSCFHQHSKYDDRPDQGQLLRSSPVLLYSSIPRSSSAVPESQPWQSGLHDEVHCQARTGSNAGKQLLDRAVPAFHGAGTS